MSKHASDKASRIQSLLYSATYSLAIKFPFEFVHLQKEDSWNVPIPLKKKYLGARSETLQVVGDVEFSFPKKNKKSILTFSSAVF